MSAAARIAGQQPVLALEDVTVSFDGFKALNGLSLRFYAGEIRCVIGPNGAGKTTMMDVITGKTRPQSGTVCFAPEQGERVDLTALAEPAIATLGIGRKLQRPTVFENLTVLENLELACSGNKGVFRTLFARMSGEQRDTIGRTLELIGLTSEAGIRAGLLAHGQTQWLEIGMLLVQEPRILLVDEPVAGMTHKEAERTAELLESLAGERTVIVVEHDMELVRKLARTVTVLHEGRVLVEGPMEQVQRDARVIEVYLGTVPDSAGSADRDAVSAQE